MDVRLERPGWHLCDLEYPGRRRAAGHPGMRASGRRRPRAQTDLSGGFAIDLTADIRIATDDVCAYDVNTAADGGMCKTTCVQVESHPIDVWVELQVLLGTRPESEEMAEDAA